MYDQNNFPKPLPEGEDQSYVPKFKTGELVNSIWGGTIGEVLASSQFDPKVGLMIYDLKVVGYAVPFKLKESDLRYLTSREFLFYRHPGTGELMVGRNPFAHFAIAFVGCVCLTLGSHFGGWFANRWLFDAFVWSIPSAYLLGTYLQYTKKWL